MIITAICGTILGVQKVRLNNLERGSDDLLGLTLGLDLQGGSHLIYQAINPETGGPEGITEDQMKSLSRTIERRVNASGLGEPIIQILGEDRLLIQLPGIKDPGRAKALIGETARLEFKHRTTDVPPKAVENITDDDIVSLKAEEVQSDGTFITDEERNNEVSSDPIETAEALVVEFTAEGFVKFNEVFQTLITSANKSMSLAQTGTLIPPARLGINIKGQEQLRYNTLGLNMYPVRTEIRGESELVVNKFIIALPSSSDGSKSTLSVEDANIKIGTDPTISFEISEGSIDEDIGLSGDDLENAYPSQHQASGAPIVNIEFNERGTKAFGELTTEIYAKQQSSGVRDQIAIILDGKELIAPVVNSPITAGTAIIQGGDFTLERVKDLALLLESGRLPVPIQLIQERDVDAMLGADSLRKSVIAGIAGLSLVLFFMILYYRVPGLIASLSLTIYAMIVLAIFKMLPLTLTLSGVAAAILSIGMAVDANILIFERMKDELRTGRTMLSSINIGFNRAWPAIRDGNVSTLITCAILYWFSDQLGATIVQGFAVTLAVGVAVSMFTAITVSRTLMRVIALTPVSRNVRLFIPTGGGEIEDHVQN
ncbi:MAG: Preprotein translocase subunit SecD/Preprotein translocase subunit SecD [Chloroflexi bacterium]|nr:MAG: Preprotein translocase subunit SecD/Preprotein translocase subunit SecD [Chloroflexota bacterium]